MCGFKKRKKAELSFSSQPPSKSTKEILQRTPKDLKKNWWFIVIVQHKAANQPVSEEQMGYIKQTYSSVQPDSHYCALETNPLVFDGIPKGEP